MGVGNGWMMDRKEAWRLREVAAEGQSNNDGKQTQEQVQGPGREQDDGGGGKLQESYVEERSQEIAQKARREFEARVGALAKGKIFWRPVVQKLWVNGRASEHSEEWMEDHYERCYDDKDETSEVQAERIREQTMQRRQSD